MHVIWILLVPVLLAASWQGLHEDGLKRMREGSYAEAASLFGSALVEARADGATAVWLGRLSNNHASALYQAGAYGEAEEEYLAALNYWDCDREALPEELARTHNNLAVLYRQWWRLEDAERHARVALRLGGGAVLWHTLGEIQRLQGRYEEALESLARAEAAEPAPAELAIILQARASVAMDRGMAAEAEPFLRRAVGVLRKAYPAGHPALLTAQGNLGAALIATGQLKEAERLLAPALRETQASMGSEHPRVAAAANNLAQVYRAQKRYAAADDLYRQALAVWRKAFSDRHPEYAKGLHNLASLFVEQGKLRAAEKLYRDAVRISESAFGRDHEQTRMHVGGLEQVYRVQRRETELLLLRRAYP